MINAYTLLLTRMREYGKMPKQTMGLMGTRIDRLMDLLNGNSLNVDVDVVNNIAVFSFSCFNPFIDTIKDIDYLYGIVGCERISFCALDGENVQIKVQVRNIIKEEI